MVHTIPHDLDLTTAHQLMDQAFAAYQEEYAQYNPTLNWLSNENAEISFSASGIRVKGTIELLPHEIVINLDVPFFLRMFQQKAIDIIDKEVRRWLALAPPSSATP